MKKGDVRLNRAIKGFIYIFIYLLFFIFVVFLSLKRFILVEIIKKLLESIAQTTGGMYVMVHNMDELSTFFRRQVLLSRFIAQTAHGE